MMAARRRLAVLKGQQWPEGNASLDAELLSSSQYVPDATKRKSSEDEWRQHHDVALEVAITRKTLQKLALYHGSVVKVTCPTTHCVPAKPDGEFETYEHIAALSTTVRVHIAQDAMKCFSAI